MTKSEALRKSKTILASTNPETGRRQAEETLSPQGAWYRLLVERMNEGLGVQDEHGVITYVNDRLCQMWEYSRAEIVGRRVDEFLDEGSATLYKSEMLRRGQGKRGSYQLVWKKKDGSKVFTIASAEPILDEQGHFAGSFAVLTDITERKRAEEALRRAHDELEVRVDERSAELCGVNERLCCEIDERTRMEEALQRVREELEGKVERQMLRRNPYGLTFREFTVLYLVAAGRTDKELASELGISPLTAQKHVANILGKMNATSRTDAGVRAVRLGLLD